MIRAAGLVVRSLSTLASQRPSEGLSGLVVYHCVREGIPGDSGPGDKGELVLICFVGGTWKHFSLFLM